MGYTQPIPTNGIFPVVDGEGWKEERLKSLARSLSGWTNYESAIEEADTTIMRKEGFAISAAQKRKPSESWELNPYSIA